MRKYLGLALTIMLMTTLLSCQDKKMTQNPFFTPWETVFGVPPFDHIKTEHFKPAIEAGISEHNAQIDSIIHNRESPTFENVIEALDCSGQLLTTSYTVFALLNAADSDDQMRELDGQLSPMVTAHSDRIYMNPALFTKVEAVYDQRATFNLDDQQLRLVELTYRQFVRAGALLNDSQKAQLSKINERLSALSVDFGNHLLKENAKFVLPLNQEEQLAGIPDNIRLAAQQSAKTKGLSDQWAFTLSNPSRIPFLTYSDRGDLREHLNRAYLQRADHNDTLDNKKIVEEMARLRLIKAQLMGFPTYAAFVLDDVMAKTPERVYEKLDAIWALSLPLAKEELEQMQAIKKREGGDAQFSSWDWWYYAEKVRKDKYALDEEMLRPYFSLDNVTSGIFQLCDRLWGISFRPVDLPLYNSECSAYEVLDADSSHLGVLYLDFFPRPGKQAGAWCGTYRDVSYRGDRRIAPVVSIVCNFSRPLGDTPSLLNMDETETYFHEFGHALHNLFSQVRYEGLGNVERDFVELPSQIMENWAFEPALLKLYAKHYQSGADIPDELVQKMENSRYFNQGFMTTELVAASYSDLDIHSIGADRAFDINAFEREHLNQKRGLISQIEPRYRYPYFSHIFDGGYAAGYYGYLWAEMLEKDAYEAFKETGDLFNREVARSFRKNILARGGIQEGMELYKSFRGSEPGMLPLLYSRGLISKTPPKVVLMEMLRED